MIFFAIGGGTPEPPGPQRVTLVASLVPALRLLGIGWFFAVSIVGGTGLGFFLDSRLDTGPLFAIIGLLVGLTVAFWGGYKLLMQVIARTNQEKGTG